MSDVTLKPDEWIERIENTLRSGNHVSASELQTKLSQVPVPERQLLFPSIYRRGMQAFSRGEDAVAEGLLSWLEKMDRGNWQAHLALAQVKQKTQGTECASRDFATHIQEHPVYRYQTSKSLNPVRCGHILTLDKGVVRFVRGGFTLPEGLTEAQHLTRNENFSAAMIFCVGLQSTDTLNEFDVLINCVSDADLYKDQLQRLEQLLDGCSVPVVNRPVPVLNNTRETLSSNIPCNDELIIPRTVRLAFQGGRLSEVADRIEMLGLDYPVLFRPAGTQTGKGLVKLDSPKDVKAAVAAGWYYLSEFHNFQSPDGYYRKYRCWSIGGRIVPNHILIGDSWNVHGTTRFTTMIENPELIKEDKAFVDGSYSIGRINRMMEKVQQATRLDYFGVDFGMSPDGVPILFEANPTMRSAYPEVAETFPHSRDVQSRHVAAFHSLLEDKIFASPLGRNAPPNHPRALG